MTLLDELRHLLTAAPEEDELPSKEELAERRRDVKSEIAELESEVQRLESGKGRREAIAKADSPEEVGRRLRKVKDRLEGLRSLDEALTARQREAERQKREERLNEVVADLPDVADRFEEAEAELRAARDALGEALVESEKLERRVRRKGEEAPAVHLDDATVDRLEGIAERLRGHHFSSGGFDHLRPPEPPPDPDRPRIIYDVGEKVRRFVGDWNRSEEHESPGRPRWSGESGWKSDYSEAEGIG